MESVHIDLQTNIGLNLYISNETIRAVSAL